MNAPARRMRTYRVPAHTRVAIMRAVRQGLAALKATVHQRLGDWAQEHFVMSGDSSHRKGRWQAWPFQIGLLDFMGSDDIEQLTVMKAKRVGYTKCLVASICYDAAHRPRKQVCYQPTDDDRDSFVKSEVQPAIDEVAVVSAARRASKGSEETIRYRQFRATVAHFLGGTAARAYRRITVSAVKFDEIDAFAQQIQKSSDPITLGRGRLEGAPFPKLIVGGTPRIKGLSHVERQAGLADARMRYCIGCPHCQAEHPLLWGGKAVTHGIKWTPGNPESVHHVCPHCHGTITQADYLRIWADGAWVCSITGVRYGTDRTWRDDRGQPVRAPRHVALIGLWSGYSPQRSWADIVTEYVAALAAQQSGDDGPLQGFTNETLAEVWAEEFEQTEAAMLRRRALEAGLPLGVVPAGACLVLAAVDVQGDRWEYVARAIGRQGQAWTIDYRVIYGNTADRTEWDAKLGPLIGTTYRHAHGALVRTSAMAIDTGYQTHLAYDFCRQHEAAGVYAVKGDQALGMPIKGKRSLKDINQRGRVLRKGVKLWHVGTDTAKDLLHGRLQLAGHGAGRQHFAAGLPETFFKGLTAEMRVPVRGIRGLEHRWECPAGVPNEPLDCTVYTMFLEEVLEIPRWTDRQWQRAESALHPDLFEQAVAPPAADPPPPPVAVAAPMPQPQPAPEPAAADQPATAAAPEPDPAPAPPAPPAVDPLRRARANPAAGRQAPPRAPGGFGAADWSSRL